MMQKNTKIENLAIYRSEKTGCQEEVKKKQKNIFEAKNTLKHRKIKGSSLFSAAFENVTIV